MPVPQSRLILWAALVALPAAAFSAMAPQLTGVAAMCVAVLAAVALGDAFLAPRRLRGLRVSLSPLTRLQKDRPGHVEVQVQREGRHPRTVRLGLIWPETMVADADRVVDLPEGSALARFVWPCTPGKRGSFFLRAVYLEVASPLGLWALRRVLAIEVELRVYPDLFAERRHVAALFLRRTRAGVHSQRFAGQGREFEKLRNYLPGDAIGDISWRASAKRGEPVTKVHQIERTHEVYVVLDASRLSARTVAGGSAQLERYVTATLLLALAAEQQGDQFGLVAFSDRVLSFVRARGGAGHFGAVRDRLYTLQPQAVSPNFEDVCAFIRVRLRRRALLVFLTALDDPALAESFTHSSRLLSRQHLLLVNMLRPPGAVPLFTPGAEVARAADLYPRLAGHEQWHALRELSAVLRQRGVRLSLLDSETITAELLAQHGEVRAKQLI